MFGDKCFILKSLFVKSCFRMGNWLAVTHDSRLQSDLVLPVMILQADQFPF